jgi:hypothetical protein
MNIVGKIESGNLVLMSDVELHVFQRLVESVSELSGPARVAPPPRVPATGAGESKVPSRKPKRAPAKPHAPKPAAKGKAADPAAANPRNKKCKVCGRAFYDDTKTNCRKFCGPGGCRFDQQTAPRREPHEPVNGQVGKPAGSEG